MTYYHYWSSCACWRIVWFVTIWLSSRHSGRISSALLLGPGSQQHLLSQKVCWVPIWVLASSVNAHCSEWSSKREAYYAAINNLFSLWERTFLPVYFFWLTRLSRLLLRVPRAVVTVGWQSSSMHSMMLMSFESLPLVDDAHADVQVGRRGGVQCRCVSLSLYFFQCSTIEFHLVAVPLVPCRLNYFQLDIIWWCIKWIDY